MEIKGLSVLSGDGETIMFLIMVNDAEDPRGYRLVRYQTDRRTAEYIAHELSDAILVAEARERAARLELMYEMSIQEEGEDDE